MIIRLLLLLSLAIPSTIGASADDWRTRSIYQLLTDRFAPPTNGQSCSTADRKYCGGNWQTIISKLDYIQGMGFDAIWISPVSQNIEGQYRYGEAYHGFWPTDPTKLNPHFGSAGDLQALSSALHARGMLLMVDMAINHLASTTNDVSNASLQSTAGGALLFKETADYHKPCNIMWGNRRSEEYCWLATGSAGTEDIALMDLATESDAVGGVLKDWVGGFVKDFGIDGFRMDATKHMSRQFQHDFCAAAGVYCTGEVFGDDVGYAASYMGEGGIDAVLGFGLMYGLTNVFGGKSKKTMPTLKNYIDQNSKYPDPTVVQAFLDNHDRPRFFSTQPDYSRAQNAIVGNFLISGIPTVYYGLEQEITFGAADPDNRNALWQYNDYSTTTGSYQLIKKLNGIRAGLAKDGQWHHTSAKVINVTDNDIAMTRDGVLIVLTRRGSNGTGSWSVSNTGLDPRSHLVELLTCNALMADDDGSVTVSWTTGQALVFATQERSHAAGLCGDSNTSTSSTFVASSTSSIWSATSSFSAISIDSALNAASLSAISSDSIPNSASTSSQPTVSASSDDVTEAPLTSVAGSAQSVSAGSMSGFSTSMTAISSSGSVSPVSIDSVSAATTSTSTSTMLSSVSRYSSVDVTASVESLGYLLTEATSSIASTSVASLATTGPQTPGTTSAAVFRFVPRGLTMIMLGLSWVVGLVSSMFW